MKTLMIAMAGLMAGCLLGCEAAPLPQAADVTDAAPSPPSPSAPAEPAAPEAPKPNINAKGDAVLEAAKKAGAAVRAKAAANAGAPAAGAPADPAAEGAPPADAAPMEDGAAAPDGALSKAEAGVGKKGQGYGGPGFVTTPIEAMFRAEERIRFEAQIPNNMKIYKAAHEDKGPATHEEFMKVIIDEGGVSLPELPQGSEYWYDVKTEQLMVKTPEAAEPAPQ
jgi:hypothetical protein